MYKFIEESLSSWDIQTKNADGSNRDPIEVILEVKKEVKSLNETQKDIVRRTFL